MPADLRISGLRFSPSSTTDTASGLLGWCSFLLNDCVRVDGVAVRRTLDGRLALSWPARMDSTGGRHALIRPINDASRLAIESAVFAGLALDGGAP